jgi:hypothetical protein
MRNMRVTLTGKDARYSWPEQFGRPASEDKLKAWRGAPAGLLYVTNYIRH